MHSTFQEHCQIKLHFKNNSRKQLQLYGLRETISLFFCLIPHQKEKPLIFLISLGRTLYSFVSSCASFCRLCQEPNHIPLRCNEVEKKSETNMRTFIENRISEAVMRKCHKCGKNFVKDIGCNKMTCICGATSCYACKKHNIGYDHFNNNKE